MTEEELEQKAEERANNFLIDLCAYCRECDKKECSHTKDAIFGYKEGYKRGYEQGQKDNCETHKDCQFLKYFEKENKELKVKNVKLKAENEKLKAQIEKLKKYKNCKNCKHYYDCFEGTFKEVCKKGDKWS